MSRFPNQTFNTRQTVLCVGVNIVGITENLERRRLLAQNGHLREILQTISDMMNNFTYCPHRSWLKYLSQIGHSKHLTV